MNAPEEFDDVAHLRTPPHSVEAEQSVLGALLMDGQSFGRIADVLAEADFYRHEHRLIFGAVQRMATAGEPVDIVTVFQQLEGEASDFGGLAYLNELSQSVPSAANIRRYAEIVAERATLRALIAQSDEVATLAFSGTITATALLEDARDKLGRIEQQRKLIGGRRVPLLSLEQLQASAQSIRWLVKHVIPAESIGMLFGASGTFKSFIALDAALHMARGLPWMGRRTKQGPALYIAAEGGAGLWPRIRAWHEDRRLRWQETPLHVVPMALDLTQDSWRVVEAAQALGVVPSLVVVDTLSQTYSGEENSANEMAAYLRELGVRFRGLWGCSVLLIHHTGHIATERPRGSSAIRANLDYMLGVFRDEKEMLATLTCAKQKDGDLFEDATFSLKPHDLGQDEDGDRVTALVARHLTSAEEVEEAAAEEVKAGRVGKNQLLLGLVQSGMREAELRKVFYDDCGLDNADARRQAYTRARRWAVDRGFIDVAKGRVISLKQGA